MKLLIVDPESNRQRQLRNILATLGSMNGWEFREAQKREPELAAIPVVLVSAIDNSTEYIASLEVMARLVKPVPASVLLKKVDQLCRKSDLSSPS